MELVHSTSIDRPGLESIDNYRPNTVSPLENLREIARHCLANEPLSTELCGWLGTALQAYLEHDHTTLQEALDLRFPRGGIPWWREEANRKRDAVLRDLASHFLTDLSACAKAKRIHTLAIRYAASAWRHDQNKTEMPSNYVGTEKEYIWHAFKSGAQMPIGERQLRNILRD